MSLELEGAGAGSPIVAATIPFPGTRVASEGANAGAGVRATEDLPALTLPAGRRAAPTSALRPVARKASLPRWVWPIAGGGIVVVIALCVVLALLRSAPSPEVVLRPFAADLANDKPASYRKAADRLLAVASQHEGNTELQLRAAELLLTTQIVHGGILDLSKIEQLAAGPDQHKLAALFGRVRALLAIAKGKPGAADGQLAAASAAENQWVIGLARLQEGKPAAAIEALRTYLRGRPGEVLAHYLLGKALLDLHAPGARDELHYVLQHNPGHAGAQIAVAGLAETPEQRLAAGRALLAGQLPDAGVKQLAELHFLVGLANRSLGRPTEARDAFQHAVGLDRRLMPAVVALSESLLYEGEYREALDLLRAAGPGLETAPTSKFALGGAQIASGEVTDGLALVTAAAQAWPDDPRGPFWQGFAASQYKPADASAAEQGYREALKRDPKFLPASLRLATLLEQQSKAEDALTVLRAAADAGAPPAVLQLAWGNALLVAKEPARAQAVFDKALATDPSSLAALLGRAAALEAQGQHASAKAALEDALKESPTVPGVRERLARVALASGDKLAALSWYQEEMKIGRPSLELHLAAAELALDLGKVEIAQSEAKQVADESPRNAEAAYVMGRAREARNEVGPALAEYRHATTWGNAPQFSLAYGRLLAKLGKVSEALAAYANTISLPEGRIERGRLSFSTGDSESALADFQAASTLDPANPEPLVLTGLCFDKLGQPGKAEEAWHAALKLDPDSPEAHYRLGRRELDRARPSAAIEHLRKASARVSEASPWRADLCFQLAQAELLVGSKPAALAGFKRYLQIAPANAPARPEAAQQVARLEVRKN